MKTIAVLMTVHNRKTTTLHCLDCLFTQQLPAGFQMDVYLTDDGCTDGTAEAIRLKYPQVNIIEGDGTLYWNEGTYKAWEEASKKDSDFYLWLNDDTVLYKNAIMELIHASLAKDDKAIITGVLQSTDHSAATYGGRTKDNQIPYPQGHLVKVYLFNGNIVWIPRQVFLRLGNLDSHYKHKGGDYDYGMRARKAGVTIYQVGRFLGECDRHDQDMNECYNPHLTLRKRLLLLHHPVTGYLSSGSFRFERKYCGIKVVAYNLIVIYLHCFFPALWMWLKKIRTRKYDW